MVFSDRISNFFHKKKEQPTENSVVNERGTKSRQSTRSLPGSAKKEGSRRKTVAPTQNGNLSQGIYVGEPKRAEDVWAKDAGPYYVPSNVQTRQGPRSLQDAPFHNAYGGSLCDYNRNLPERSRREKEDSFHDDWSDVASDMYRTSRKPRYHSKREDHQREHRRRDKYGYPKDEDYHRSSSSAYKHAEPIDNDGYSSRESSMRRRIKNGVRASQSHHEYFSSDEKRRRYLKPSPEHLLKQYQEMPPPAARPPKHRSKGAPETGVLGEKWVDGPKQGRLVFEEGARMSPSSLDRGTRSPRIGGASSMTPPRSPGSAECDRLIIQSLRAELAEERTLRLDSERKVGTLEKEKASLQSRIGELVCRQTKLENDLNATRSKINALEEEKQRLKTENSEIENRLLDDIAGRVASILEESKKLQKENQDLLQKSSDLESRNEKLNKDWLDLAWNYKLLKAQLRVGAEQQPLKPHNHENTPSIPDPSRTELLKFNRISMGNSDPALWPSNNAQVQHRPDLDENSPLVNGRGEGMFSRPNSFSMDTAMPSPSQAFRVVRPTLINPSLFATPPSRGPLRPPFTPPVRLAYQPPLSRPQPRSVDDGDDTSEGDELRNFAEPSAASKQAPIDSSPTSSIEKARAADTTVSSLHSEAFIRSILSTLDRSRTLTPTKEAPQSELLCSPSESEWREGIRASPSDGPRPCFSSQDIQLLEVYRSESFHFAPLQRALSDSVLCTKPSKSALKNSTLNFQEVAESCEFLVSNGSPERMCEMEVPNAEAANFEEEEAREHSFYAICSTSFTSSPIPPAEKAAKDEETSGSIDCSGAYGRTLYDDMLASTSGSFTSDDSEAEGLATIGEWFKQLKHKKGSLSRKLSSQSFSDKNVGKSVVRYTPPGIRPSILKQKKIFTHFGPPERKALAHFDFLQEMSSPEAAASNVSGGEVKLRRNSGSVRKPDRKRQKEVRKSRSWSNLADLHSVRDFKALKKRGGWTDNNDSSHSSSLFLSDLCAADLTFSSNSSISFQCP